MKEKIDFSKGLIPTVVINRTTGEILMLAFSSPESLKLTIETGFAHFFSRERNKIWKKGEESGNTIKVFEIFSDCDNDSLVFLSEPSGPACHTGEQSCFFRKIIKFDGETAETEKSKPQINILLELQNILKDRKENPKENSYSSRLFSSGLEKILSKITEESRELCESALKGLRGKGKNSVIWEAADLLYHILSLLVFMDIPFEEVLKELRERRK